MLRILPDFLEITRNLARPLIKRDHCPVVVIGLSDDGGVMAAGHAPEKGDHIFFGGFNAPKLSHP